MTYKLRVYNHLPEGMFNKCLNRYANFVVDANDSDVILLRSHKLTVEELPKTLLAVGRVGSGVDNVPVSTLTELGIPIFNAPGANSNAVKEMVFAGLFLACRHLESALSFVRHLECDELDLKKKIEDNKKQFSGCEIRGKTLGVIGLGNVGGKVATTAPAFGMKVLAYDPYVSAEQKVNFGNHGVELTTVDRLLGESDFVTLHVPLTAQTVNLMDGKNLSLMKPTSTLLNFSRKEIVNEQAILRALTNNALRRYVTDFPTILLKKMPEAICLPHIGGSTQESLENCLEIVMKSIDSYLEYGEISNSVNFPNVSVPREFNTRIKIISNPDNSLEGKVERLFLRHKKNVKCKYHNKNDSVHYALYDFDAPIEDSLMCDLLAIKGVNAAKRV